MAGERPRPSTNPFSSFAETGSIREETDSSSLRRRVEIHSHLVAAIKPGSILRSSEKDKSGVQQNGDRSTARTVIETLKGEKQATKLVVVGPMEDGQLLLDDSLYQVYIVFINHRKEPVLLTTSRKMLLQYASAEEDVDALVLSQPDIREETLLERQRRLLLEIQGLNRLVLLEKTKNDADEVSKSYLTDLNNQKTDRILDYLETSLDIEDEHPKLDNIFDVEDSEVEDRIHIEMRFVRESDQIKVFGGEESNPKVGQKLGTSLKRSKVKEQAERYKKGSKNPYDEVAYELIELLIDEGVTTLRED